MEEINFDFVATNAYPSSYGWEGSIAHGDIQRKSIFDHQYAFDWQYAAFCNKSVGELNTKMQYQEDNGSITGMQSVSPKKTTTSFSMNIVDTYGPQCKSLERVPYSGSSHILSSNSCTETSILVDEDQLIHSLLIKNLEVNFDDLGELTLILSSPTGSSITLYSEMCPNETYMNVNYSDSSSIELNTSSCPLIGNGDFFLLENLKNICNEYSAGNWTLGAHTGNGTGEIVNWELEFILYTDWNPPVAFLEVPPIDNYIECGQEFTWIHPVLFDNSCTGEIVIDYSSTNQDTVPKSASVEQNGEITEFFGLGTTTVTYTLTDDSENTSQCSFDVIVEDPNGYCVHPCQTDCLLAVKDTLNISLDENCEALILPSMVGIELDYSCNNYYTLYLIDVNNDTIPNNTVTNSHLNTFVDFVLIEPECENVAKGKLWIEDKFAPQIACNDVTISCADLVNFPMPSVSENCGNSNIILLNETSESVECDDPLLQRIITRTYQAEDESGNLSNICSQTLSITKFDIGTVSPPVLSNIQLECGIPYEEDDNGNPDPLVYGSPQLGGKDLFPDQFLICNLFVDYEDITIETGVNDIVIVRTWTASSWYCGMDTTKIFIQLFDISDQEGPEMTCSDDLYFSTTGFDCTASVELPAIAINDVCGNVVNVNVDYEGGILIGSNGGEVSLPVGSSVVTYIAYDDNGNSNSCTINVIVDDNEQPETICKQFTEIALTNDGIAIVSASTFDGGSFDPCGEVTLEVRRMNTTCDTSDSLFGESITFCCADIGEEQMIVLRVTDESGNYNECMVMANIVDNIAPQLIADLPDITISCEFPYNDEDLSQFGSVVTDIEDRDSILLTAEYIEFDGDALDAFVLGNCSVLLSDEIVSSTFNSCGQGSVTREITLVNSQGDDLTIIQELTFINPSPFSMDDIDFPDDIEFTNLCDINQTLPENLPAGFNEPTFVEDQCDQVGYTYDDVIIDDSNGSLSCYTIIRTFTVLDWCQSENGQFVTFTGEQEITVNNTLAPEITGNCSDVSFCSYDTACGPLYVELVNSGTDDCTSDNFLQWTFEIDLYSNNSIDIIGDSTNASGIFEVGLHTITWTLKDGCGQQDQCTYTFEVKNCSQATPICLDNLTAELVGVDTDGDNIPDTEEITITSSYFDGGSFHVCGTPVSLSFSSIVEDSTRTFGCEDIGEQLIELWVTDINGNQDFCVTTIDIQNNTDLGLCYIPLTYGIQGEIYTEIDDMIVQGSIELIGGDTTHITDEDGQYDFGDMPTGGSYIVNPIKDIDYHNGITTLDILLIQKHILGSSILNSPYKIIAADVDNNSQITGQDIIQIRKLILGHFDEFPDNTSWRFIDSEYEFLDPLNPWISIFPENYEIDDLNENMVIDFIGLKVGDVNNSASPDNLVIDLVETRSNDDLELVFEDKNMKAGEAKWVKVYAENFQDIIGLQFGGAFSQKVNILDIKGGALNLAASNYILGEDNSLKLLWHNQQPISLSADQVLFELLIQAGENLNTAKIFDIDENLLKSEAYDNELDILNVKVLTRNSSSLNNSIFNHVKMEQNEPNPWMTNTSIIVNSESNGEGVFRVMNSTGKIIFTKMVTIEKGENELMLSKDEILAQGILYYELEFEDIRILKKMVIIK